MHSVKKGGRGRPEDETKLKVVSTEGIWGREREGRWEKPWKEKVPGGRGTDIREE